MDQTFEKSYASIEQSYVMSGSADKSLCVCLLQCESLCAGMFVVRQAECGNDAHFP